MAKKIKKKAKRKTAIKRAKKMEKTGAPENKMVEKKAGTWVHDPQPPTLPTGQVVGKDGMSEKIDFAKEVGQITNQGSNNGESDAQKV